MVKAWQQGFMIGGPIGLACCLALSVFLGSISANAQQSSDPPVVARATIKTSPDLQRFIALGLDVLEMREGDDLFILTTSAEVDRLTSEGWTVAIDTEHTAMLRQQQQEQQQRRLAPQAPPEALVMGGYRTVPEMRTVLDDKAIQYPNLAEVFVYGSSWERVTGGPTAGHDLFGINLTNKQRAGPKPTLFLMAAIHARELSTSELALRFVDYLLSNYGVDGDATWLLDEHLIVVVPVANPDGRVLAEQGYYQRKNTDTSYGTCTIPDIGVDLNRNSSFKWGTVDKPTQSPCSQFYPGPVQVSEPETAALQTLVRALFPDQRGPNDTDASPATATGILLTIHSYSDLVLWPWGWTNNAAPNGTDLAAIGRKFSAYNGYTPEQAIRLYPSSGTTDDWVYGELGIAAFTFEVGPSSGTCGGFFPPFTCLDGGTGGSFWPRNLPAFLYAARIARTPFQLAQGPTAESATAALLPDSRVELQVQLDERANGGQAIVAAEYYVDTPPWSGGTPIPMTAADGNFDSTVEIATAVVGPFTERHMIFMRGQDSTGAWGAMRAVFSPDPNCPGSLSPTSQSVGSGGGTGTVGVTIPNGCAWTASTVANWITITSGMTGTGNGSVSFAIAPNTTTQSRSATIIIAGQSFAVTEDAQQPADLLESTISNPPATAVPGTSFSVTDTVQNVGGTTAGSSTSRYYLSANNSKDAGDKLMSGGRPVPALAPGTSSTGTVTVTTPSTMALGTYFLLACADDTTLVIETDETNNCKASATTVQVTRPDLIETGVSNPSAAAAPSGTFSVTDTAQNQGAVSAAASTTRYYLSLDGTQGAGDKLLTGSRAVPSLAAGASSPGAPVTVTIPSTTALGTYYLLACADDTTVVTETNETNNCIASAATVNVTRPDLIETAVNNPPSLSTPGGTFTVTDTAKNQGTVSAAASTTRYYLSLNNTKGTGDKLLTGTRAVPTLAAGVASSGGPITVTVPSTTALGTYFLLACADDATVVVETDETNNCVASATTVQVTEPDLIETTITNPPTLAAPGGTFSVTDTTKNQGAVSAGASTTRYYLSLNNTKGTGDILLTGTRAVGTLTAGAPSSGPVTVTIGSTTVLGTYFLLACADDLAKVTETSETNNCVASATTVQVTRPDLVETAVTDPPANATAGSGFSVTDTTQNNGAVTAAATTTRFYLSLDTLKGSDHLLTGTRSVPTLGPGLNSSGPVNVTIPTSTPTGSYFLLACADDTALVTETNETNNCKASVGKVTVGP